MISGFDVVHGFRVFVASADALKMCWMYERKNGS